MTPPPTYITLLGRLGSLGAAQRAHDALGDHLERRGLAEADAGQGWVVSGLAPAERAGEVRDRLQRDAAMISDSGEASDWVLQEVEDADSEEQAAHVLAQRQGAWAADTDGYLLLIRAVNIVAEVRTGRRDPSEAGDLARIRQELLARGERSGWAVQILEERAQEAEGLGVRWPRQQDRGAPIPDSAHLREQVRTSRRKRAQDLAARGPGAIEVAADRTAAEKRLLKELAQAEYDEQRIVRATLAGGPRGGDPVTLPASATGCWVPADDLDRVAYYECRDDGQWRYAGEAALAEVVGRPATVVLSHTGLLLEMGPE